MCWKSGYLHLVFPSDFLVVNPFSFVLFLLCFRLRSVLFTFISSRFWTAPITSLSTTFSWCVTDSRVNFQIAFGCANITNDSMVNFQITFSCADISLGVIETISSIHRSRGNCLRSRSAVPPTSSSLLGFHVVLAVTHSSLSISCVCFAVG